MRRILVLLVAFGLVAASAVAVDASSVPSRLDKIQPGEWIILQDTSGDSTDTNKITVTARNGNIVKLRREHYDADGKLVETTEHDFDIAKYAARSADVKSKALEITEEFMMIDEEGHDVFGILWEDNDKKTGEKHQYKVLVSPNLPLAGIARFWTSNPNTPTADVIGYGFGK